MCAGVLQTLGTNMVEDVSAALLVCDVPQMDKTVWLLQSQRFCLQAKLEECRSAMFLPQQTKLLYSMFFS